MCIRDSVEEEQIEVPKDSTVYTYDDILGKEFKLVNSADYYEYDLSLIHIFCRDSGKGRVCRCGFVFRGSG